MTQLPSNHNSLRVVLLLSILELAISDSTTCESRQLKTLPLPLSSLCVQQTVAGTSSPPELSFSGSVRDVTDLLFSAALTESLVCDCPLGMWCLEDDAALGYVVSTADQDNSTLVREEVQRVLSVWSNSSTKELVCPLQPCISQIFRPDSIIREKILTDIRPVQLIIELLCSPTSLPVQCSRALVELLHVVMADLRHSKQGEHSLQRCRVSIENSSCSEACHDPIQRLLCTIQSCPAAARHTLRGYLDWSWIFADLPEVFEHCDVATSCMVPLHNPTTQVIDTGEKITSRMRFGGQLTIVVAMISFLAVSLFCLGLGRCYSSYTQRKEELHNNRVEYQPLKEEDFDVAL